MNALRVVKRPLRTGFVDDADEFGTAGAGLPLCFILQERDMSYSKECQVAHWKYHRSECKTADTAGQSILGDVKGQLDRGELVSYDHLPCYDAIGKLRDDLTSFSKSTSTAPYISSDNARKLLFFSEQVQFQHEQLEEEIDHVLKSLHQTFETFHIPIPKRNQPRYKRLAQLKSKENLQSLLTRCQSQKIEEQLESIKECRKLLSGKCQVMCSSFV